MLGVVGRVKRTPRFDARGTGLLHFVRNDGRGVSGLPRVARNDGRRGVLDCFTLFAMTGVRSVDCFTLFAMTGGGVAGLPRFARNDGEIQVFCSFRYFIF